MEADLNKRVLVLPDPEVLSHRAASIFIELACSSIDAKGRFIVAISGGTTPKRLFDLLGTLYSNNVEWVKVEFFWADERCVPKEHDESNFRGAYSAMLSRVPVAESNIHRIKGELEPEEGARQYENEIRKCFGKSSLPVFDLILLGIGEDGHTASLFPGSKSLEESERLAIPVYVERLKSWRVTLTLPVLNNARHTLFLATGSNKTDVLAEVFEKRNSESLLPAGLIRPVHGDITWLVDKEAAAKLKRITPGY